MYFDNPILDVDSYKFSHFLQNPPGLMYSSSYIEPREGALYDRIVWFGLQAFIRRYMSQPFTNHDVESAEDIVTSHGLPFNPSFHALAKMGGKWPVKITALPEGTIVKPGEPVLEIVNTNPSFPWVTSFLETSLLRAVWYPSTVATVSRKIYDTLSPIAKQTCENPDSIMPFRLHDFGARGATCREAAALGGMAHLVNFMGTDTIESIVAAKKFYDAEGMPGISIPAAEHSTITSWGQAREEQAYNACIQEFGGAGKIYAVVSDSYDLDHAVNFLWGQKLKDALRKKGGTVVVRPDSGDPVQTPLRVIEALGAKFGFRTNGKGFKVLDDCVRVIQGDGMTPEMIEILATTLKHKGWSLENIAFGMGGGLLQKVDRDTLRWAMKCNAVAINQGGQAAWKDVQKKVVTDPSKSSKAGRIKDDRFITVYEDGKIKNQTTFAEVRYRANS